MRKLSEPRRRVVALAGSLACMSGVGPVLLRHHPLMDWVWWGLYILLRVCVIVLMVRLRREEGCE